MVILRKVKKGTKVVGKDVDVHKPTLRFRGSGGPVLITKGQDVEFLPAGSGSPRIVRRKHFLPLGKELDEPLRVKSSIITGPVPALARRVILAGGKASPIQVDKAYSLDDISMQVNVRLENALHLESNTRKWKHRRKIANGILFHRKISSADPVRVQLGTTMIEVRPTPPGELGKLPRHGNENHYVVWVVNYASRARVRAVPEGPSFDRDFYLLYKFLEVNVSEKFVPEVFLDPAPDVRRSPPGVCMNGLVWDPGPDS